MKKAHLYVLMFYCITYFVIWAISFFYPIPTAVFFGIVIGYIPFFLWFLKKEGSVNRASKHYFIACCIIIACFFMLSSFSQLAGVPFHYPKNKGQILSLLVAPEFLVDFIRIFRLLMITNKPTS